MYNYALLIFMIQISLRTPIVAFQNHFVFLVSFSFTSFDTNAKKRTFRKFISQIDFLENCKIYSTTSHCQIQICNTLIYQELFGENLILFSNVNQSYVIQLISNKVHSEFPYQLFTILIYFELYEIYSELLDFIGLAYVQNTKDYTTEIYMIVLICLIRFL